jgi:hypothetical protein
MPRTLKGSNWDPVDELTVRKLARNEALFREVNNRIHDLDNHLPAAAESRFVCECPDKECIETVAVGSEAYEALREDKQRFFVVPGHENEEIERVTERTPTYLVVKKLVPVPDPTG